MRHSNRLKGQYFSRRAVLLGGIQLAAFSVLAARMYKLQILDSSRYSTQADGNRIRVFPVPTQRGKILDRNGKVLAKGVRSYQALYKKDRRVSQADLDKILREFQQLMGLDEAGYNKLLAKVKHAKSGKKVHLNSDLSWKELATLEVALPYLKGIEVNTPELRHYPYGASVVHLVGYVGRPNAKELERLGASHPLYRRPDYQIGKTGLERQLENELQGQYGARQIEVDAKGKYVRELKASPSKAGKNVTLTVDMELQDYVIKQLHNKGGLQDEAASAVVLDIKNGDVLAMASVPSYDPDLFIKGMSNAQWQEIINNPDKPLSNKTISSQYPPGSTFKTITALAGLHKGIIDTKTEFRCNGYHEFGGRRFRCWNRDGHGKVNVERALAVSCNVFFYNIATKIGIDEMAKYARKFGLGSELGIELPGELDGLVPTKAWKKEALGKSWYRGETLNASIGQGYCLVTPLQLAVQIARFASGGRAVEPHIIHDSEKERRNFPKMAGISRRHLSTVLRGMNRVVNEAEGAVYRFRINDDDHLFAGKTGTAQVVNRSFKNMPADARQRYHALFIGYAPVDNPRYAVSVVVEHGGYGSAVAAPIAANILKKAQGLL